MSTSELDLINNGAADVPYRLLTIDDKSDSLLLRTSTHDIAKPTEAISDKNLQLFITRLKQTLAEEAGVGIAAPQVGLQRSLFLFMRIDKPGHPVEVAINPKIVKRSEDTFCFEGDGCLSIPGVSGNSIRNTWIDVEYYNEEGRHIKERLSGGSRKEDYTGIIFQHEYDHLQGILFIDKLCE